MAHPLSSEYGMHHGTANAVVLPGIMDIQSGTYDDPSVVPAQVHVHDRGAGVERVARLGFFALQQVDVATAVRCQRLEFRRECAGQLFERIVIGLGIAQHPGQPQAGQGLVASIRRFVRHPAERGLGAFGKNKNHFLILSGPRHHHG